ncbi:MAG: endolytic transglycosylase MltG [Alphaproteobacteria bacterium]|nr:endolytic transglycosylase MltG [Alphaproteobacteria bacterium]
MIQSRFFHALIFAVSSLVVVVCTGAGILRHIYNTPANTGGSHYLYIEPGTGLKRTAWLAEKAGIVSAAWHFSLAVRSLRMERSLYAGEYEIAAGQSLIKTLEQIRSKQVFHRRVVIPEGLSVVEVLLVLRNSFGLVGEIKTAPEEGSLLPDTYFYVMGDDINVVVERMKKAMTAALLAAWEIRAPDLPFDTVEEALILASIVEKETAVAEERPLVAAVFVNRLKKGMRLQSDPTVIYGVSQGVPLNRPISRADLRMKTPYNTYRINGLPPTPIANPGLASIEAVLNPAFVPYVYFVADGTGGHAFAETLSEHNRNVARWRKIEQQR